MIANIKNLVKLKLDNKTNKIVTIFVFILSVVFSYMILELLNGNMSFSIPFKHLLFNFILIILTHLLIYSLTNSIKITMILTNSIFFLLGFVNYIILCLRGTPIVPWDLLTIKTASHVSEVYSFTFSFHLLFGIVLFVLLMILAFKMNYKFKFSRLNLILRLTFLVVTVTFACFLYKTDMINYFNLDTSLWEPKKEYANNGFLASFVKQSKNLFNLPPEGYSIEAVKDILDSIPIKESTLVSNTPNIIVIMSESFSDLAVNRKA